MLLGLLQFIYILLDLCKYILLAQVIVSWLLAFNVLNMSNQFVAMIANALYQLTEPVLRPIRRMLPNMNGLDLSPLLVFLGILFIQTVVLQPLMRQAAMGML